MGHHIVKARCFSPYPYVRFGFIGMTIRIYLISLIETVNFNYF